MRLKHYVIMMLICSYSMRWNDHDTATVWSEWNASNRYRIIAWKIGRSIFERFGTIRSLDPAATWLHLFNSWSIGWQSSNPEEPVGFTPAINLTLPFFSTCICVFDNQPASYYHGHYQHEHKSEARTKATVCISAIQSWGHNYFCFLWAFVMDILSWPAVA